MRDHRSLEAWKEAREVVRFAYSARRANREIPRTLLQQLQRSALSVQLNIAEGYALKARRRFANHLTIALGSAVETADILEVGLEEGLLPFDQTTKAIERTRRCQALIFGLIKRYRHE